jgi:hypothetical protein
VGLYGLDSSVPGQGSVRGSSEHGNESFGFYKMMGNS